MTKRYFHTSVVAGVTLIVALFVSVFSAVPAFAQTAYPVGGTGGGTNLTPAVGGGTNVTATPAPAATSNSTCPPTSLCNPLKVGSIQDLLYLIVNIATYIGVILGVLALIWVGFKFIAAQGNSDKLKEARGFFYAVVIGIAILISANAIVTILKNTLTTAGVVQPGVFGSQ